MSVLCGQQDYLENTAFVSAAQAVASAARVREIRETLHRALRHFQELETGRLDTRTRRRALTRLTDQQRVLRVLESKINLFELVVGELDLILGRVNDDFDLEASIFDAFVRSGDDDEFDQLLDSIGDDLAQARRDYLGSRGVLDALVGEAETE